jgi:hypothetical protein
MLLNLSLKLNGKTLEATAASDVLLELNHSLLVTSGVRRLALKLPGEELVGVVGDKVLGKNLKTLAVLGDLVPVTLDVLQVGGEVSVRALEDLAVDGGGHLGLHVDVLSEGLSGVGEDIVSSTLASLHELGDLVLVGGNEAVVGDVEDGAEAAAAELSELVNAEHLDVILGAAVGGQPLLELDHLDVLKTDTAVDGALDDGLGDVHAATDGGVVVGGHAVVLGELVDLDL